MTAEGLPADLAAAVARPGDDDDRYSAGFHLPSPTRDVVCDPVLGQERTVRMRVTFRDGGLHRDEAVYVLRLSNQETAWRVVEDETGATLSGPCKHLRPAPPPGRVRPHSLTREEHDLVEALLRRYLGEPDGLRPTILTQRIGDNQTLYALDGPAGGAATDERSSWIGDREFLSTLAHQGHVVQSVPGSYLIQDSLFRAYGLEPLAT